MIESRYPFTYCADFLRSIGPHDGLSPKLSRADASAMKSHIARALRMDDAEFARLMADEYCRREGISKATGAA